MRMALAQRSLFFLMIRRWPRSTNFTYNDAHPISFIQASFFNVWLLDSSLFVCEKLTIVLLVKIEIVCYVGFETIQTFVAVLLVLMSPKSSPISNLLEEFQEQGHVHRLEVNMFWCACLTENSLDHGKCIRWKWLYNAGSLSLSTNKYIYI